MHKGHTGGVVAERVSSMFEMLALCFKNWKVGKVGNVGNVGTFHICLKHRTLDALSGGLDRESREGWPLLTVQTDVNGDSKSTK